MTPKSELWDAMGIVNFMPMENDSKIVISNIKEFSNKARWHDTEQVGSGVYDALLN